MVLSSLNILGLAGFRERTLEDTRIAFHAHGRGA